MTKRPTTADRTGSKRDPPVHRRMGPRTTLAGLALLLALVVAVPVASAAAPHIGAPAYILIQPTTGDVVLSRNASQQRLIASTTKMMTALLTVERLKLTDVVTVQPYAATPGESLAGLTGGQRMRVSDLLRGLMLPSGNDAAATLAVAVSGSLNRFVKLMNAEAHKLGLHHTHYANPVGLDAGGNYSSARDLAKLALMLRENAFLRRTMNLKHAVLHSGPVGKVVVNTNALVQTVPWVNGVKTGHTNRAGFILVGSGSRHGVPVVSVVLDASSEDERNRDSLALLRYGVSRYRRVVGLRKGQVMVDVKLAYRDQRVPLVAGRTVDQVVRRGEHVTTRLVGVPAELNGPLPAGAHVATIDVRWRGTSIARVPLVTERAIPAATIVQKVDDVVPGGLAAVLGVLGVLLVGSLLLLMRRRRRRKPSRGAASQTSQETEIA